jgi:hypothetical protein
MIKYLHITLSISNKYYELRIYSKNWTQKNPKTCTNIYETKNIEVEIKLK